MLTYEIATGYLITADGTKLEPPGYSGNGDFKNVPDAQDIKDHGPIPEGFYTLSELIEDDPKTGPYSIVLAPDEMNSMFGRSSFRIHGDSLSDPGNASDGCIVQARPIRVRVWTSQDHRLRVIDRLPVLEPPELT